MASTGRHLVVDGSNIATEGRTLPSLAQLDEAVRAVLAEDPDRQITVIVDATFAHRIDSSESEAFEDASNAGEVITPPAGTVGRGDAFILQVAEKAQAAVLSNDSFQEFHGEHDWLFEDGRLIGGKPVADVGWVFIPRVPVRGPASRRSIRESKSDGKSSRSRTRTGSSRSTSSKPSKSSKSSKSSRGRGHSTASGPAPKPSAANPPPSMRAKSDSPRRSKPKASAGKSGKSDSKKSQPKNDSHTKSRVAALNSAHDFLLFVTQFSIGDEIRAVVERFSSHGCYLRASSAQCYLPSSEMGDPPPTRARDVVALGQEVIARVESIDSDRRGINVVLVRTEKMDGVDAVQSKKNERARPSAGNTRGKKQSKTSQLQASVADESAREAYLTRSETNVATKKTTKKASAKKRPVKKAAKATSSARATKAAAKRKKTTKKAPAKKAAKKTTKKAPAKKAAKKTTKKAPAKKAAKKTTKKAPAKKATKKTTRR